MAKSPAFQFYIRDWLSDPELQSASASSRGIWINALCYMWESRERGKLEGSVQSLSRLLNCSEEEFHNFLTESEFFHFNDLVTHQNGKVTLINRRMHREDNKRFYHNKRQDKYRKAHIINMGDAVSDSIVTPCSSSSSSSSTTKNKDLCVFGFEYFWKAYPKKKSKGQAEKIWKTIKPNEQLLAKIIATIEWAKTSEDWTKDLGKWIPYPATWLNAKGWEDEIVTMGDTPPTDPMDKRMWEIEQIRKKQNEHPKSS